MEKLSSKDIKFLKSEIIQLLLGCSSITIVLVIVHYGCYLILQKLDIAVMSFSLIFLMGFFYFIFKSFNKPIKDLMSGEKHLIKGRISKKSTKTKYLYSQNAAADFMTQPKLFEYYITVDNTIYFIREEEFKKVNEDEVVVISLSSHSKKILAVRKE